MPDTTTRQETDKEVDLNHIMNQLDLTDTYGTLNNRRSHVLSSMHQTFSIKTMLSYKTSLNIFKRILTVQSTFSDHNTINSEISNRRKFGKFKICGS